MGKTLRHKNNGNWFRCWKLASERKEKMDVSKSISFYRPIFLLTDFFNLCMNSVVCNFFIRLKLLVWKMCPQKGLVLQMVQLA